MKSYKKESSRRSQSAITQSPTTGCLVNVKVRLQVYEPGFFDTKPKTKKVTRNDFPKISTARRQSLIRMEEDKMAMPNAAASMSQIPEAEYEESQTLVTDNVHLSFEPERSFYREPQTIEDVNHAHEDKNETPQLQRSWKPSLAKTRSFDTLKDADHAAQNKIITSKSYDDFHGTRLSVATPLDNRMSSDRCLFKELGNYNKPVNYEDYKYIQDIIDEEYRKFLKQLEIKRGDDDENDVMADDDVDVKAFKEYKRCLTNLKNESKKNEDIKVIAKIFYSMPEFKTIKRLGEGQFGVAFLIVKSDEYHEYEYEHFVDPNLLGDKQNLYVLKKITFPNDAEQRINDLKTHVLSERLPLEISLTFSIAHPNVCRFFGGFSTNFFCVFLYEYLCCGNVREIIMDNHLIDNDLDLYKKRILFYSAQLLLALEYLHDRGIYHGDVNEDNICLDYRGYAKLIDFGNVLANGDEVPSTHGITSTIAKIHIDFKNGKQTLNKNDYAQEYLDRINQTKKFYEIDMFGLVFFFLPLYHREIAGRIDIRVIQNEVSICVLAGELEDCAQVPTAKEFREEYEYYADVDFKKLLLREYDLASELQLDLAALFDKFSRVDPNVYNFVFTEDERINFKEKNTFNYIRRTQSRGLCRVFSNLQLTSTEIVEVYDDTNVDDAENGVF